MGTLEGRIALVTGAGQGVGQGIAFALAAEGAAIAVSGRTASKLDATVATIAERGGRAAAFACNVKEESSLAKLVDDVVSTFGTIDILVNNAQEVPLGPLEHVSDAAFTAGWESGPLATFRLMKLCYPHLKGGGSIVNLSSIAGTGSSRSRSTTWARTSRPSLGTRSSSTRKRWTRPAGTRLRAWGR